MLDGICKFLKRTIKKSNLQAELEAYVSSKKPTSTGEVEYWIKEFDRGVRYGR